MAKESIVAGLDLGTSTTKCVVGVKGEDGAVDIIGTGSAPARGFRGSSVHSRVDAVKSIQQAVAEAELMAGCELKEVYVALSGTQIESFNSVGVVRVRGPHVTEEDRRAVLDVAQAFRLPAEKEVCLVVPREFVLDGAGRIAQPVGLAGVRLEVRAHVVTGPAAGAQELESCCREVGLRVVDVVLAPLAAAETLLTQHDHELGVVLIDIGGSTTEVAVFKEGGIVFSTVIPLGGDQITADVHDCLHLPTVEAERLKQQSGCALTSLVGDNEQVELPGAGGRKARTVKRTLLCEIIEARTEELLKLVDQALVEAGLRGAISGGAVLTGGATNLHGISELAEQVLGMPATRGVPRSVSGLVDVIKNPRYATATGLVLCAAREKNVDWFSPRLKRPSRSVFERLFGWMR